MAVTNHLMRFEEKGIVKFDVVLSVPSADRIPGLMQKYGSEKVHALIIVMLTEFSESLNLIRPMTAEQVVSVAFELMNTSNEDFLSIEDLAIFFKGAKAGKYGKILDRLDHQVIFELLEQYRQQRHMFFIRYKEEEHAQLKSCGPTDRGSEDEQGIKDLFRAANVDYLKSKFNQDKTT